ncbi:hypothetical protein BV22DRAFT_1052884 [Leucogyrophana mollusca]|uniref:Uncharacterized protein n=1 Tax=Leucogyrophana mollusca TaxID=85980 RepID=A0ACB8C049_9AGAM|nr:hypothetical protein BV22DRAFT_1052884 [Leucogyrophana mollusca]
MTDEHQDDVAHACKCLNIRIRPQPHHDKPPDFLRSGPGDSEYTLTYVGEEGLHVAHPQVTMRTRKLGPLVADSSRCIRFTTLACLLCQSLVYRVQQQVPPNIEGQEGPLLPTHDWVEQETLKSSSGWIEVHRDCLDAAAIARISSSTSYSALFALLVPPSPTSTSEERFPPSPSLNSQDIPSPPILPINRPLFPPAPFTPSHPVFAHLSSIASNKSLALRTAAEEYLSRIVRDKVSELEKAEDQLREEVGGLWSKFLDSLARVEKEWNVSSDRHTSRRRDSLARLSISANPNGTSPLISVRDFVPVASPPARVASPASVPRVSSLSASIATSSFHHPRAAQEEAARLRSDSPRSPPPYSSHPSSPGSVDSRSLSSSNSSSEALPHPKGESILQPFQRSMDEAKDTAASFRYFTDLEADIVRARQQQPDEVRRSENGDSQMSTHNAKVPSDKNVNGAEQKMGGSLAQEAGPEVRGRHSTPRGKRKVTFDIKPDALTGEVAVVGQSGKFAEPKALDAEEMIFDLDDSNSDHEQSDDVSQPVLPLLEAPHAPARLARSRLPSNSVLPASLSSLRPTSLPVYSPLRSLAGDKSATKSLRSSPNRTSSPSTAQLAPRSDQPEPFDPQETEILKLVAADTPSHRGAWRKDSKAWQVFVSRQGDKGDASKGLIPEDTEGEDAFRFMGRHGDNDIEVRDEWNLPPGIPASLPVDIGPLSHVREPLSLASYQPKTSLSDRVGALVPPLPGAGGRYATSASLRRASYAERDRSRLMDPGALDFAIQDEDEDGDESEDELSEVHAQDEGRGRQRAFKILEARSKIPAEGIAVYAVHDEKSNGHVTVTTQGEGIHILNLSTLHSVASHAFGPLTLFSGPAISRYATENGTEVCTTYAIVNSSPEISKENRDRTIWMMKQNLSMRGTSNGEKRSSVVQHPVSRIFSVGHTSSNLVLVSASGDMTIVDDELNVQSHFQGSEDQELLDSWIFPRTSCSFMPAQPGTSSESLLVSCFRSGIMLSVRVATIDTAGILVPIGSCEIPLQVDETPNEDSSVVCQSCSSSGILTFINNNAEWVAYHLDASSGSSLTASIVGKPLSLAGISPRKGIVSLLSLGTSLVLLAASTGTALSDISLLLWDLQYGVVIASYSMPIPSSLVQNSTAGLRIALVAADDNQVLLTLSPIKPADKSMSLRSTLHVIPFTSNPKSSLAQAMGKAAVTARWLVQPVRPDRSWKETADDGRARLLWSMKTFLDRGERTNADQAFLSWADEHNQINKGEQASLPHHPTFIYGHEFVKDVMNLALRRTKQGSDSHHSSGVIQHLLEKGEVRASMVEGGLLISLRERSDWENILRSFKHVADISEDEMISIMKSILDFQRDPAHTTEMDRAQRWIPPLATYLFACVSYPTSSVELRLAIRKHIPNAADLVYILEALDSWLFGGTEDDIEIILKAVAANMDIGPRKQGLAPPYPKVISFLQVLLDASFVTLLQYPPSHNLLRRILEHLEPEVGFLDRLEHLRGVLEPFKKAHSRMVNEKVEGAPKETPAEWRKRKKRLEQQAALGVGLYRLEEILI